MGISNSYVLGFDFLRLWVTNSYLWRLVFLSLGGYKFLRLGVSLLTFGVSTSYVCWLVFLRLWVSNSYVWGLVIFTFWGLFSYVKGYKFLRLVDRFFTFWGQVSFVWGLVVLSFGG